MSTEEHRLTSPCGLYCGGCPLFQARTDATLRKRLAEARGVPEDRLVLCAGCRPLKGKVTVVDSAVCPTYACIEARGLEFCYECPDFPCLKLAPCADRAADIPHNTKIYNLLLIRRDAVDSFVANYRTRIRQYLRGKKPNAGGDIKS